MKVIGITGSLGTGKTTVALFFKQLGAESLDADKIAHELLEKGKNGYRRVVKSFGHQVLTETGEIDRKILGEIVFKFPKRLKELENIIHPAVIKKTRQELVSLRKSKTVAAVVLDVPLLYESGMDKMTDFNIVVRATKRAQVERAKKALGLTPTAAKKRIAAQLPLAKKLKQADYIIDNRGTKSQTKKQVQQFWADYIKMNKRKQNNMKLKKANVIGGKIHG